MESLSVGYDYKLVFNLKYPKLFNLFYKMGLYRFSSYCFKKNQNSLLFIEEVEKERHIKYIVDDFKISFILKKYFKDFSFIAITKLLDLYSLLALMKMLVCLS